MQTESKNREGLAVLFLLTDGSYFPFLLNRYQLISGYSLFDYSRFAYFRPKSGVSPVLIKDLSKSCMYCFEYKLNIYRIAGGN